jgi:hypothetical protein
MHRRSSNIPAICKSSIRIGLLLSVVIHDFYVVCPICLPTETDAKLIVDPDAVLTFSVSYQCFQSIGRRNPQVFQPLHDIHLAKPADGDS